MHTDKNPLIITFVAFTTARWDHALAVLRILATLHKTVIDPFHSNSGEKVDADKVSCKAPQDARAFEQQPGRYRQPGATLGLIPASSKG